nr:hypothetical protein [Tanacetum cinerariifolium]
MVLYLIPDDVPTVPAIPAPYWDDVTVISSDEEYSSDEKYYSDDEKYNIPEDDVVLGLTIMENASKQDVEKAVDNVVSNHGKVVDNVYSNLLQPKV